MVVNNEPLWDPGEGWHLTPEPLLTLGVVDTPFVQQFHEIRGVTRLRDSTIVVLNSGSGELRAFDYSGHHRWTAGGRGDGPGELRPQEDQRPLLERNVGDTIEIDVGWERIRFDPSGELVDHRRLDFRRLHQLGRYYVGSCPQGRSYFRDLIVICQVSDGLPKPGRRWQTHHTTVMQIPWTLDRVDTVGIFFRNEHWETRGYTLPSPPYPAGIVVEPPIVAPLGSKGRLWMGGRPRPRLLYARNDTYRIEVWDLLDATLSMVVERRTPRRARTEAEILHAVRGGLLYRREPDRSELSPTTHPGPVVDSLSIAESFFLDDQGFLWVRRRPVGDDLGRRWEVPAPPDGAPGWVVWLPSGLHDVFRPDGVYLGTVKLPHDIDIMEIGADYVLGVARDEMGVEYVQLFGLERGV